MQTSKRGINTVAPTGRGNKAKAKTKISRREKKPTRPGSTQNKKTGKKNQGRKAKWENVRNIS